MSAMFLKFSNTLRTGRKYALTARNWFKMKLRARDQKNNGPCVIVLSLGSIGASAVVAKEAKARGFNVHVFCQEFPVREAVYADDWSKIDCRDDFDQALALAKTLKPVAILVESKNLLLPMQHFLADALGLRSVGDWAAKTSNSKINLRQSIDQVDLANLPWCALDDYELGNFGFPAVIKPDLGTASKGVRYLESAAELEESDLYSDKISTDPSVGDRMLLEGYVEGRQFDVEGVAFNGEYHLLAITEEFYEDKPPYFPPSWFHFNPPIEEALKDKLWAATKGALKALGVTNGAWHVEQRVDQNGIVYILDYANRMGFNLHMSEASGVNFAGSYVELMTNDTFTMPPLKPISMAHLYALDEKTLLKLKKLASENKSNVFTKVFFPYEFSFHRYLGDVAVRAEDYATLHALITAYDLLPPQFDVFYPDAAQRAQSKAA